MFSEETLTANDTELGIETRIEGNIIQEGNVALDAKFISEAVRKLPDSMITIDVDDNFFTKIKCEKVNLEFSGKNGEEFTAIPNINRVNNVFISDYSLKELIKQTIFCVGEGSTNQIMNSELVHINGDNIELQLLISADAQEVCRSEGLLYYVHSHERGRHHLPHVHVTTTDHNQNAVIQIFNGEKLEGNLKGKLLRKAKEQVNNNKKYFYK